MNNRKSILIMADWYEPGFKAGGPIRSCVNFAQSMKDKYQIMILTSDRDIGEDQSYEGIETDKWVDRNGVLVFYISPKKLKWGIILDHILKVSPDFIYLNGIFSLKFTIYPLMMRRLSKINSIIILAPRGMLKESALQFSSVKKKVFIFLFKMLAIQKKIRFHATDLREVEDIKKNMGKSSSIMLISNFPAAQKKFEVPKKKERNFLSIIFVGRIHPIKNLDLLLLSLQAVTSRIQLTIVAPIEDEDYWKLCKGLINKLPPGVTTDLRHNVGHDEMEQTLLNHHILALPTKGENFGHAIFESLAVGRPVLISDQTPWKNLSSHYAGWDLPLDNMSSFTDIIQRVAEMQNDEFMLWCRGAWEFCHVFINKGNIKQEYAKLFD